MHNSGTNSKVYDQVFCNSKQKRFKSIIAKQNFIAFWTNKSHLISLSNSSVLFE